MNTTALRKFDECRHDKDLDRTVSLTEQRGGRLLEVAEARALLPDMSPIEYVGMHLARLEHEVTMHDEAVVMTAEQFGALLDLAFSLEDVAEACKRTAKVIRASAPTLWYYRQDPDGA